MGTVVQLRVIWRDREQSSNSPSVYLPTGATDAPSIR